MKPKPKTLTGLAGLGALFALSASAHGQAVISTAQGNGADTYLTNDGNTGPGIAHGTETAMELREWETVRMRHLYFRFDISSVSGDLSGATITVNCTGTNRGRILNFVGVVDGATGGGGENWDEATTSFAGAAGIDPATPLSGQPVFSTEAALGTGGFGVAATLTSVVGLNTTEPSTDLDAFIAADTDGLVTFIVSLVEQNPNGSAQMFFETKESGGIAPYITFPNASPLDTDGDDMPDFWEDDNGLDKEDPSDATGDPDGDTFDNLAEYNGGSDPNVTASVPGDVDGDGLADIWEDANFGDNDGTPTAPELALQDGAGDPDVDWCSNEEEETAATNPNERDSAIDPLAFIDTDADGINDCWELQYYGNLTGTEDPTDDTDGDGADSATEYANFSNPADINSVAGDIDGDGVPDIWEDQYYGNNDGIITDVNAADDLDGTDGTPDADGDGADDTAESNAIVPSNPNDINSVPDDADGDGLSDAWELTYFDTADPDIDDINRQNGLNDSDNDLYTNEEEETAGTDPAFNFDFPEDSDGDGQNDRWELLYYGDLTTSDDAFEDTDGDGEENEIEYEFGSDPTNPDSTSEDIDGDGLLDDDEITFFDNVWDFDGTDDPDGDLVDNDTELNTDLTDPTDAASVLDSDADGLGDAWEIFSYGDITTTDDPLADDDSDTYDNGTEFAAGTNGNDAVSTPDSDNDGLPDGYEISIWGDAATQTGEDDSDGGGASNLIEFYAGTNPDDGGVDDPASVDRTTADGAGADSAISNDGQNAGTGPGNNHGAAADLQIRHFNDARLWFAILRFDIGGLSGDLSEALLQLNVTTAGMTGTWSVYGLNDGDPGENWDESTITYLNMPGVIDADRTVINEFSRDARSLPRIGGFSITDGVTGLYTSTPGDLDLSSFIANDTDGVITLVIHDDSEDGSFNFFTSKEGAVAPRLIFPNAIDADTDLDGLPDSWEIANFGNLDQDGTGDPDGDSDDNATEQLNGTDPNDDSSFTDTDADGLPDNWETDTFGNLDQDGAGNPDGDDYNNTEEYWAGTNANDGADFPIVPAAVKRHEYTFNGGTFADSAGSLDGTITGTATITGGSLNLGANGDTGELDAATLAINTYDSVSIEFWATSNDAINTGFSALLGLGEVNPTNDALASNYLLLATHRGDNFNRFAIGTNNQNGTPWLSENGVNSAEINDNSEHHYVGVINEVTRQVHWYVDGVSVGQVTTQQMLADVATEIASIGALYPADATWQGSVNELRIYEGVLTSDEVAANFAAGPSVGVPANVMVTDVSLLGTTLSVTLEGLESGAEYHWEGATDLTDFSSIAGTTFTGDGNPEQTEDVTVDPVANPTFQVRVVEGAAPAP